MLSFIKHCKDYTKKHRSNTQRLTLNAFFDQHYFPTCTNNKEAITSRLEHI